MALQRLQSADIEDPALVEVQAALVSAGNQNTVVEQAVARLSLEPSVSAVRWEVTTERHDSDGFAVPGAEV